MFVSPPPPPTPFTFHLLMAIEERRKRSTLLSLLNSWQKPLQSGQFIQYSQSGTLWVLYETSVSSRGMKESKNSATIIARGGGWWWGDLSTKKACKSHYDYGLGLINYVNQGNL